MHTTKTGANNFISPACDLLSCAHNLVLCENDLLTGRNDLIIRSREILCCSNKIILGHIHSCSKWWNEFLIGKELKNCIFVHFTSSRLKFCYKLSRTHSNYIIYHWFDWGLIISVETVALENVWFLLKIYKKEHDSMTSRQKI